MLGSRRCDFLRRQMNVWKHTRRQRHARGCGRGRRAIALARTTVANRDKDKEMDYQLEKGVRRGSEIRTPQEIR
jgi:hypothetical protein